MAAVGRDQFSERGALTALSESASGRAARAGRVVLDALDQGSAQGIATRLAERWSLEVDRIGAGTVASR